MMKRRCCFLPILLATFFCLAAAIPVDVIAQDGLFQFSSDVTYLDRGGNIVQGVRCATVDNAPANIQRGPGNLKRWIQQNYGDQVLNVEIPDAFHVIHKSDGTGNVPDSQINDQIAVLNEAYAGTGFSFILASLDRTQNDRWFKMRPDSLKERLVKKRLAIDPTHTLNIYTCQPSAGILGWATFPWMYEESNFMHGVVMLYSSLPGGAASPYDEGDTATHEVGHYLGLYHTFQGGCVEPGDRVDDTPYEAEPAFGCPVERDTCPQAGLDPIHNFMDYVDDACMFEFTAGQADRTLWAVTNYKPGLLDGSTPLAPSIRSTGSYTNSKLTTIWAAVKE